MMSAQQSLIDKICGDGVLPLYADDNATRLFRVIDALVEGGVRTFEFTNRKPNALPQRYIPPKVNKKKPKTKNAIKLKPMSKYRCIGCKIIKLA
jgi:hypothetical protein